MKRYVIYGAGAIGGAIGGCLLGAGAQVTFIARGENYRALADTGLRLRTPISDERIPIDVVLGPQDARIAPGDIVVLAMKTQDTAKALQELAAAAPHATVLCAQNGVENERLALRQFADVYGGFVFIAAAHLTPGQVNIYTGDEPGVVDVGRVPGGMDAVGDAIAADFRAAGFDAEARPDIMAWKRAKLLMNLLNGFQAVAGGTIGSLEDLADFAKREGERCLDAAGLDHIPLEIAGQRLADTVNFSTIDGEPFPGGSSWQSMERGTSSEVEYLNGEIVLLGRQYGVPTPVNLYLHETVRRMVVDCEKPGILELDDLRRHVLTLAGGVPDASSVNL